MQANPSSQRAVTIEFGIHYNIRKNIDNYEINYKQRIRSVKKTPQEGTRLDKSIPIMTIESVEGRDSTVLHEGVNKRQVTLINDNQQIDHREASKTSNASKRSNNETPIKDNLQILNSEISESISKFSYQLSS